MVKFSIVAAVIFMASCTSDLPDAPVYHIIQSCYFQIGNQVNCKSLQEVSAEFCAQYGSVVSSCEGLSLVPSSSSELELSSSSLEQELLSSSSESEFPLSSSSELELPSSSSFEEPSSSSGPAYTHCLLGGVCYPDAGGMVADCLSMGGELFVGECGKL
ncbi:MAG: hypothetical protein FWB90_01575 [Fibromonadales bacterium]|nr:hypothetical protein [Fibromonadales bacterium]